MRPGVPTIILKPDLLKNLSSLGYESMTPIQALSLPAILSGEDVIGQGKIIVANFTTIVADVFQDHGITTKMYNAPVPNKCEYH
jgi:hypothetical protein